MNIHCLSVTSHNCPVPTAVQAMCSTLGEVPPPAEWIENVFQQAFSGQRTLCSVRHFPEVEGINHFARIVV